MLCVAWMRELCPPSLVHRHLQLVGDLNQPLPSSSTRENRPCKVKTVDSGYSEPALRDERGLAMGARERCSPAPLPPVGEAADSSPLPDAIGKVSPTPHLGNTVAKPSLPEADGKAGPEVIRAGEMILPLRQL